MKQLALILFFALTASAQFPPGSTAAKRIRGTGATLPAACVTGDVFIRTGSTAPGVYGCTADNTWVGPSGVGSTGDVEGPASSVDGEAAVFDGITGKLIKRFAGSGVGIFSSGVLSVDSGLQFNTGTKSLGVFGPIVSGQTSNYLGQIVLNGITSGAVTIQPANAAGTWTLTLPNSGGTNGQALVTNGSGVGSWANPTASALSAQYIDWNAASGGNSIANKPTLGTAAAATLGTGAGQVPVTGDYQPSDTDLTAIAALACTENQIIKRNGSGTWICAADATGGSPTFDGIGAGTNTTAAMVVGTGASLAASGSGTIAATSAAALAAQYIDWNAASGGTSIANKPNVATAASGGSLTTSGAHAITLTATGATNVTLPTSGTLLAVSGSGTGVVTLTEGTAPGAGAAAGEHNLYFDSADSRLKSHENGGSVVEYAVTTGNIATATALAANGANCSAGQAPLGVDASGAAEGCFAVASPTGPTLSDPVFTGSAQIPNGASPTVDAAGEIAVDTTTDQLQFYGAAKRALPSIQHVSFVIPAPAATDDMLLMKAPYGMTILTIRGVLQGTTNVIGQLQECNSSGASCVDLDSDITFDGGEDADDGTLTDNTVASGNWIAWKTTSVSGTPTFLTITVTYRVVAD